MKWIKSGFYTFICLGMTESYVHLVVVADQFIFVDLEVNYIYPANEKCYLSHKSTH